jgi:hypothetical protein
MLTIVTLRNEAKWRTYIPTPTELNAVRAAWAVIEEWIRKRKI